MTGVQTCALPIYVVLVCEARLAVKSTLERTRAQRFLDIATRGSLPVPLNYYGAHTGRWAASKGSGINLQNLKRKSFLRRAIHAPDGYVLGVCDLSQIEPEPDESALRPAIGFPVPH